MFDFNDLSFPAPIYHSITCVVTNDKIQQPEILDVGKRYITTYPFFDLSDYMELIIPHDPQTENTLLLIVNLKTCKAGYRPKDVRFF